MEKQDNNNEQKIVEDEKNEVTELTKMKDTILLQKEDLEEKEDRLKRLMAEFDNFKKRSAKEREGLYNSLISDIFSSLLPVIDNLEKAVIVNTEDENYKQGIELVLKQFKDVLLANGVQEIETIGQTFDPELHEAVASVTDETLGEKEIKEEYRKGYKIGNKVIRHSMVVVAN
ncbi:MAG: nucleotide exchange factor GrpE [Clostridiaceae bacterium]|nr:nucleotide exchange factor GrpE [Clostridiaceae bacterium]